MKRQDKIILKNIRKGDIQSFENLFHRHYERMCLYALKIVKKTEIAEEISQDVFYNIWKNRTNFLLTSGWESYLYKAVYNNSLYYLRKTRKEIRINDADIFQESLTDELTPESELDLRELTEDLGKILNTLPERTGRIFRLSRFEGKTYREIAEELAISVKTVEDNMGKALKVFRKSFKELGYLK